MGSWFSDDYCNYNSSGVVLHVGGNYNQNQNHGAFYLNGNNAASNQNSNIGCRHLVSTSSASFASGRRPKAHSLRCASSPAKTRCRWAFVRDRTELCMVGTPPYFVSNRSHGLI